MDKARRETKEKRFLTKQGLKNLLENHEGSSCQKTEEHKSSREEVIKEKIMMKKNTRDIKRRN